MAGDGLQANGYFDALKDLIQEAYTTSGDLPAIVVAHSMVRTQALPPWCTPWSCWADAISRDRGSR